MKSVEHFACGSRSSAAPRAWNVVPVLLAALALATASAASPRDILAPDSSTTIFVVRHAERMPPSVSADPPLNAVGIKRAHALAHALGAADVSVIYVTAKLRSRQTALPLADALGESLRVVDGADVGALARRIRSEDRGRTVLVVGHSDTVPLIVQELSGLYVPPLKDDEFDWLYVVTLFKDRAPRLLRLKFGDSSGGMP